MFVTKGSLVKLFLIFLAFVIACLLLASLLPESHLSLKEENLSVNRNRDEIRMEFELNSVQHFWPEIKDDLTLVKWAHAVNSKELLEEALNDETMMLEADVSLGTFVHTSGVSLRPLPIMAHPPKVASNLTLKEFLNSVKRACDHGKKKGVKLDFKTIDVVKEALELVDSLQPKFPVWINADLFPGPGSPSTLPVNANRFLELFFGMEIASSNALSIGWTTAHVRGEGYTQPQIEEALDTLGGFKGHRKLEVTFPIRAAFAFGSREVLKDLLRIDAAFTTFTLWTAPGDLVVPSEVAEFIKLMGKEKCYLDVPEDLERQIKKLL